MREFVSARVNTSSCTVKGPGTCLLGRNGEERGPQTRFGSRFGKLENRWGRKLIKINNNVYTGKQYAAERQCQARKVITRSWIRRQNDVAVVFFTVGNNRRHAHTLQLPQNTYTADGTSADPPRRRRQLLCIVRCELCGARLLKSKRLAGHRDQQYDTPTAHRNFVRLVYAPLFSIVTLSFIFYL